MVPGDKDPDTTGGQHRAAWPGSPWQGVPSSVNVIANIVKSEMVALLLLALVLDVAVDTCNQMLADIAVQLRTLWP